PPASPQAQTTPAADTAAADPITYTGEPVTLKIMYGAAPEWWELIRKSIEDKFPNIKVEQTKQRYNSKNLEELFAKGESLDLFVAQDYQLAKNFDMTEPIDDKIAASKYDLSIYRDGIIDNLRSRDPEGKNQLYGLPISEKRYGLFYNKSIFDKFGAEYPKDGMTIDQTLELAQKVTGERDGVKYKGLTIPFYSFMFTQFGVSGTDPKTGEVLFSKEPAFRQYFEMMDKYKHIPGMIDTSDTEYSFDTE
uniref:ABC transporter substrate-binding protein n=1 Tax=Paenibacillus durus TaxID=44251 RepID=UPI000471FC67